MAVQTHHQPNDVLQDLRPKNGTQGFGMEAPTRALLAPAIFPQATLPDFQLMPNMANFTQDHLMPSVTGSLYHLQAINLASMDNNTTPAQGRKRARESTDQRPSSAKQQLQQIPILTLGDYSITKGNVNMDKNLSSSSSSLPQPNSLGLRLAFEDEKVATCSPPSGFNDSASPSVLMPWYEDISKQMAQQNQEFQQFLIAQTQRFRQSLEEKRQRHVQSLLSTIEEAISRQLYEKELDLNKARMQSKELEEQVKNMSVEAHYWKSKAMSNEAVVSTLRASLQKAVAQSREQSREGSGESEANDDAASAILDENADARARGFSPFQPMLRPCQICRASEANILMLPCRHLSACRSCETSVNCCPLCNSIKAASVEIYLS